MAHCELFLEGGPQLILDIWRQGVKIKLSPPIQFRIEWADSQEKSPLFGCRPILILGA
jgi:hypothetical protein